MSDDVADFVRERGITEILHFTHHQGLTGILGSRLVHPRSQLRQDQLLEFVALENAAKRQDTAWLDYVNLSISRINGTFFEICSNRWHSDLDWRVLSFDPEILSHDGVWFTTTNNIYPSARRAQGVQGLSALFADVVLGRYKARLTREGLDDSLPTCIQAEVLYRGSLSTDFLRKIYVRSEDDEDDVVAQCQVLNHQGIEVLFDPSVFAPGA